MRFQGHSRALKKRLFRRFQGSEEVPAGIKGFHTRSKGVPGRLGDVPSGLGC